MFLKRPPGSSLKYSMATSHYTVQSNHVASLSHNELRVVYLDFVNFILRLIIKSNRYDPCVVTSSLICLTHTQNDFCLPTLSRVNCQVLGQRSDYVSTSESTLANVVHYIMWIYQAIRTHLLTLIYLNHNLVKENHTTNNMWDKIAYPFPNFNSFNVEVWEWLSNLFSHF